ncbi:hypothetical protein M5K25_004633 [Dendrobium thyrsiflorum]|uniref:Uncharacterized protein n=1 Tax=Dendrobium thyrsiflorum TaxID=117978 RepID=A0ABD0VFE2_DENTH
MAQILLHGTLHVTIYEADSLSTRASAGAPRFLRKVGENSTPSSGYLENSHASGSIRCNSSRSDHVSSDSGLPLHLIRYLLRSPTFVELMSSLKTMSSFSAIGIFEISLEVEVGLGFSQGGVTQGLI